MLKKKPVRLKVMRTNLLSIYIFMCDDYIEESFLLLFLSTKELQNTILFTALCAANIAVIHRLVHIYIPRVIHFNSLNIF